MAIQPIDLQTLYTQLDKVGKQQQQQQQAAQISRDVEKQHALVESEKKIKKVKETNAGEEAVTAVHDQNDSREKSASENNESAKEKEANSGEDIVAKKEIIRDPALGRHIDISG